MNAAAVIETTGLVKRFGQRAAVDHLSLAVPAGSVYGFLGPNGSGKTTTIRMLLGLIAPSAGTAKLLGHDVQRDLMAGLREVGAQVESPAFCSYLSGRRNLEFLGALSGGASRALIDQALARVRLSGRDRDKVRTYSQGMKARLALAQALLCQPKLLVLDEPTNGLDPQGMREVRELVRTLAHDDGMTIFLSSHLLSEVQQVCDRVAIINHGQLVVEGSVDELLGPRSGLLRVVCEAPAGVDAAEVAAAVPGVREVTVLPDGLRISAPDADPAELNARLVAAGVRVRELSVERLTLEAYFIDVTGAESQL